jgi:hypothetical protein
MKVAQNFQLQEVAGTIVSKAGTITGTAGVGSSLFLQRIMLPQSMNLSEIDVAMSIGFPATNQGAGTMSRSLVLYSFGNSTSLASVFSISGTSAWNTGTSTAGTSVSLTQFQGGWSSPLIQPMTFASTLISPGEYVVGQLFNFAQGSSTWTLNFYGVQAVSTFLASAATNLTSASLAVLSAGGLLAASAHTGSASIAVLSNAGTLAVNNMELSSNTFAGTGLSALSSATSVSAKTVSIQARTIFSAAPTVASVMSSSGLLAGSFITASTAVNAVTNVALGALNSSTLAQLTLPNFGFIGTGSTTSGFPTAFVNGIMSTGAIPVAITLTSAAVTYSGSAAFQQPWFQLCGL